MNNPISQIHAKFERVRKDLGATQEQLKNLREDHSRLIKDSIKVENSCEKVKQAINKFCDQCVCKANGDCALCALHEVAVEFELWN